MSVNITSDFASAFAESMSTPRSPNVLALVEGIAVELQRTRHRHRRRCTSATSSTAACCFISAERWLPTH